MREYHEILKQIANFKTRINSKFIQRCARGTCPSGGTCPSEDLPEGNCRRGITLVRYTERSIDSFKSETFCPYRLYAWRDHDARRGRIRFSTSRFGESISVDGSRFPSSNVGTCLFHLPKTIPKPSLFLSVLSVAPNVATNSGESYRIGSTYTTISTVCNTSMRSIIELGVTRVHWKDNPLR